MWGLLIGLSFLTPQVAPAADRPPLAMRELHASAIAVFDAVAAHNWTAADARMATMGEARAELPRHGGNPDVARQLNTRLHALGRAVRDRQTAAAMTDANWVARLTDELETRYDVSVPGDVHLLAFYGRALEIDARTHRRDRAKRAVSDLKTVWERVEPSVLQRHDVDEARRFTDLVARLDGARADRDIASAAQAEVAEAERVLSRFQSEGAGR